MKCMSCGTEEARWLVTWPYDGVSGAGRLLAYGDVCRLENIGSLWVAVPLRGEPQVLEDLLASLYRDGLTKSEPATVAEHFQLTLPWVNRARTALEAHRR